MTIPSTAPALLPVNSRFVMSLQACLNETHQYATPEQWSTVRDHLPQQWIEQALQQTGVATLRKRRLPMTQVMWLVLGIALLRDRSILHVADALGLALPAETPVCSSALSQARQRLGSEPLQWPAEEVFALYHERWEIELAYGEIKTDMHCQAMTLRSQHPDGIKQALWATLLMYNLIRLEIAQIAQEAAVAPCRISFMTALRYIVDEWLWSSSSRSRYWPSSRQCAATSNASSCRLAAASDVIHER